MPIVTRISQQKRRPNRRNVYLDERFAFDCNLNVVARFRLREGLVLSDDQVGQITQGEVRQECFDSGLKFLERRLHSRAELARKLARQEFFQAMIEEVLDDLTRLGYVDDDRFAHARASSAAQHKHHGRRRAKTELLKAGIGGATADRALDDVYRLADPLAVPRALAMRQSARLRRLDPLVARRRLSGMLARRGFDYDAIKPVIDEVLGKAEEE